MTSVDQIFLQLLGEFQEIVLVRTNAPKPGCLAKSNRLLGAFQVVRTSMEIDFPVCGLGVYSST